MKWSLLTAILVAVWISNPSTVYASNDTDIDEDFSAEYEYVTFGDNCNKNTSRCEDRSFLVCSPLGQCECPVDKAWSEKRNQCEAVESKPSNLSSSSSETDPWPEEDLNTWVIDDDENEEPVVPEESDEVKVEPRTSLTEEEVKIDPEADKPEAVNTDTEDKEPNEDKINVEEDEFKEVETDPEDVETDRKVPEEIKTDFEATRSDEVKNEDDESSEVKITVNLTKEVQIEPRISGTEVEKEDGDKNLEISWSDESDIWDTLEDDTDSSESKTKVETPHSDFDDDELWADTSEEDWPWSDETPTDLSPDTAPVPTIGCLNDLQCQGNGSNLNCNLMTGRCECFSPTTVEVNGTCRVLKTVGSPCATSDECDDVIQGSAWCHLDLETSKSTCQCSVFSDWEEELSACLRIGTKGLESECRRDWQCTAGEALGPHARCSEVTGLCECANVLATETRNIRFFDGKCIAERDLEEACRTDQDCEASLGVHAVCLGNNTCGCREGHSCTKIDIRIGSFSIETPRISTLTFAILGTVGTVFLVGGVLFLVMRRRDNYTFVTNEA